MSVERYRVSLTAVFPVEDPAALLALAREQFTVDAPQQDIDMFLPDAAAGLEHVLDPGTVIAGLPGVAFVRGTVAAATLQAEDE